MASESAEVAEDYRHALEDLSTNMRFEISNLTVIARENTEHALAIADVLQQHILKVAPSKKLPSLYVLDSIVKNVGTPYTLYFGRNLFKTFMESYAVVDNATRKRMEEMLKTWKQPVAGSMDTRPVFTPELVRPIENALMKARAAMMPQGQLPGRPRSAMQPPHRNTPTPPGMRGIGAPPAGNYPPQHYPHPNGGQPMQAHPGYPVQQQPQYPSQSTPQPLGSGPSPYQPPALGGYVQPTQSSGVNIEGLNSDIANLVVAMKAEFAQNPHDPSVQVRLQALLDLQGIVQRMSLPQDQLELIKKQVNELAAVTMKAFPAQSSAQPPHVLPQHQQQYQQPRPPSVSVVPPTPPAAAAQASVSLDSLLGKGALAALMARSSSQTPTPNPPAASLPVRSPQPATVQPHTQPPTQGSSNPLSLIEQLRAAGLMTALTPTNTAPIAPPPPTLPPNLSSLLSAAKNMPGFAGLVAPKRSLFDPAALKQQFRPDIVAQLYDELGPPCTQCGRRFKTNDEGRKKKMAHMDWHFKVYQRSNEAEKRGMHRSWYVDHNDWLKSREVVDSEHVVPSQDSNSQAAKTAEGEAANAPPYIPVPEASSGVNTFCPICQDKFVNKWLDTVQEWVWLDAVLVGGRAYHASCHAEATRDREEAGGPMRRTPEPVLGKRKAEAGLQSPRVRSLKTSA